MIRYMGNVPLNCKDIVAEAAQRTGVNVYVDNDPEPYDSMWPADAMEAYDAGYSEERAKAQGMGAVIFDGPAETDLSDFWRVYEQLRWL